MENCSKRILIVEDNLLLASVQRRLLQKIGHEVIGTIDNGQDALQKVKTDAPDIIFMDLSINGPWDGIETMHRINEEMPTPVIFLSGTADLSIQKKVEKMEEAHFLTKPVNMNELEKTLQCVLKNVKVA